MRRSVVLVVLLGCGCGAEAASTAAAEVVPQDVAATDPPSQPPPPAPLEHDGPVALQPEGDGVIIRGLAALADSAPRDLDVSVGLDWVVEESLYPVNRTTARAELGSSYPAEFELRPGERPLTESLVANEATNRAGVGVAYLTAFVDADANGFLGCKHIECEDYRVGSSPNAMVVYAEEAWPADGEPLFGFNGMAGVRPPRGWSLVHLDHSGSGARPIAREWTDADTVEVVIIGDFRELDRGTVRSVQLDVD